MSFPSPQTHFDRKVSVWTRILTGCYQMDRDTLEIASRFAISLGIIILIFLGKMPGSHGGLYVTIIMGIDIAAIVEAVRQSQINNNSQKRTEHGRSK